MNGVAEVVEMQDKLESEATGRALLFYNVKNRSIDAVRKRGTRDKRETFFSPDQADIVADPSNSFTDVDNRLFLEGLLADCGVPPERLDLLIRHHVDGVEIATLAEELNANPNTIKTWLSRTRKTLLKQAKESGVTDLGI